MLRYAESTATDESPVEPAGGRDVEGDVADDAPGPPPTVQALRTTAARQTAEPAISPARTGDNIGGWYTRLTRPRRCQFQPPRPGGGLSKIWHYPVGR
jgi:hypothetical protein